MVKLEPGVGCVMDAGVFDSSVFELVTRVHEGRCMMAAIADWHAICLGTLVVVGGFALDQHFVGLEGHQGHWGEQA